MTVRIAEYLREHSVEVYPGSDGSEWDEDSGLENISL